MKSNGTSGSPTRSVVKMSISTILSLSISPYLCLPPPPPVCSVHLGIEAVAWHIAGKETLRGVNEMLHIDLLPHQPSGAFDDFSTPVFDRPLVNVIPSHIVESA
jgi:hypothetical protein